LPIDVVADLFPPCTADLLEAENPDVYPSRSSMISQVDADRDRLTILGDGNRIPQHIIICFHVNDDVLADLLPSGRVEIVIATHQGEDPHISFPSTFTSRRATDYSHAVGSDVYRSPEIIPGRIAVDGLAELHPVSAIVVHTIDFDVACTLVIPYPTRHKCPPVRRESH